MRRTTTRATTDRPTIPGAMAARRTTTDLLSAYRSFSAGHIAGTTTIHTSTPTIHSTIRSSTIHTTTGRRTTRATSIARTTATRIATGTSVTGSVLMDNRSRPIASVAPMDLLPVIAIEDTASNAPPIQS